MKILFVCENYLPHLGGAEVVFKNLAERYVKRGHQVSLITHRLKGTKKRENINGVEVYRINCFNSRYLFSFFAVSKVIELARDHDIIQTTSFNGAPPAWLGSKVCGKPVIITVHEVWADKWQQVTNFSWLKSKVHQILERAIYFLPYDKYLCVSNATKHDLLKLKINKSKVETVYNGLDYKFWNTEKYLNVDEIRSKLDLENKFSCFAWGRPGVSKGFDYLLKAVPLIIKQVPNFHLILMLGSKEKYQAKYQELIELISKLKLDNYVRVIDAAPYQQLGNYIKAADCIIIPSIAEGFGYTTVEAAALGKPLVVSDAGSLPEVVSGKHLMFKSKDIADLAEKVVMASKDEYQETPLKRFEWEPSVEKYLDVYSSLITLD
jgi:D-inositol-3-phosphate glycosyltransferase